MGVVDGFQAVHVHVGNRQRHCRRAVDDGNAQIILQVALAPDETGRIPSTLGLNFVQKASQADPSLVAHREVGRLPLEDLRHRQGGVHLLFAAQPGNVQVRHIRIRIIRTTWAIEASLRDQLNNHPALEGIARAQLLRIGELLCGLLQVSNLIEPCVIQAALLCILVLEGAGPTQTSPRS